ncbi:MAG: Veg family protein [Aristaeellaceae bacterium]
MAQLRSAPGPSLETVREHIRNLYETSPRIRITVAMPHSKVVQDSDVTITGVYPHVFCVEECAGGVQHRYAFQYADVITQRVRISDRA